MSSRTPEMTKGKPGRKKLKRLTLSKQALEDLATKDAQVKGGRIGGNSFWN